MESGFIRGGIRIGYNSNKNLYTYNHYKLDKRRSFKTSLERVPIYIVYTTLWPRISSSFEIMRKENLSGYILETQIKENLDITKENLDITKENLDITKEIWI